MFVSCIFNLVHVTFNWLVRLLKSCCVRYTYTIFCTKRMMMVLVLKRAQPKVEYLFYRGEGGCDAINFFILRFQFFFFQLSSQLRFFQMLTAFSLFYIVERINCLKLAFSCYSRTSIIRHLHYPTIIRLKTKFDWLEHQESESTDILLLRKLRNIAAQKAQKPKVQSSLKNLQCENVSNIINNNQ